MRQPSFTLSLGDVVNSHSRSTRPFRSWKLMSSWCSTTPIRNEPAVPSDSGSQVPGGPATRALKVLPDGVDQPCSSQVFPMVYFWICGSWRDSPVGKRCPGARLIECDDAPARATLRQRRLEAVLGALREVGARRVVDLGCGEGHYLRALLADTSFTEVVGVDVSARELERAERRLGLDRMPDQVRGRLSLRQSSVTYRDDAITGFDAVLLVEVVEHLDPDRVPALVTNVFGHARPATVVLTTPNAEHNVRYGIPEGRFRHPDHRFEWTRAELRSWAEQVAAEHGYRVELRPVGDEDPEVGPPTQLALFTREEQP